MPTTQRLWLINSLFRVEQVSHLSDRLDKYLVKKDHCTMFSHCYRDP